MVRQSVREVYGGAAKWGRLLEWMSGGWNGWILGDGGCGKRWGKGEMVF